jgi:hypothetical protein
MIKKPNEVVTSKKKIRFLLAGFPGIGKTTLALSSPKPLLIDVDRGIDRVAARNRKDFTQPETYEELLNDLKGDLSDYETLVFDTGGKLLDLMKPYVIKKDSKNGQKDGQTLSIKGYGAVGKEFQRLMDYAFYQLNKNVVVIFHAKEDKDGEATKLRILVEGSTKDNVWQPMDLGGFVEMYNGKRTIGFDNCERYYAKGTHGIKGIIDIPSLDNSTPNDFLTRLFDKVNQNIEEEQKYFEEQNEEYKKVMNEISPSIENMTEDTVNVVMEQIKNANHVLTSEKELKHQFKQKLDSLNMKWDFDQKKYVKVEVKDESKEISDNSKPIE